jgi:hypothetical protein
MGDIMAGALPNNEKKSLSDYLLTEDQVSTGQFPRDEIFEIQIENKIIGPFWQEDLKDFLSDANLYKDSTLVKSIDEGDWKEVYSHPYFQRRRPSLVSTAQMNETQEDYYILKDGQKDGPYERDQLMAMVDRMELLITDFVSIDEGQSWGKLYEHDEFDRRSKSHDQLPTSPDGHVFDNSVYDADKAIAQAQRVAEEQDAIVGLAYIGHLNEGKRKVHIEEVKQGQNLNSETPSPSGIKNIALMAILGLSIIGGVYFSFQIFSGSPDNVTITEKRKKSKTKPVARKALPIKNAKIVKPAKRKPSSFGVKTGRQVTRGSQSIRKAEFLKMKNKKKTLQGAVIREVPPEAIFDDANEAVELDPIRTRLSKDVIDPLDANSELSDEELEEFSRDLGPVDENGNPLDAQLEEEY